MVECYELSTSYVIACVLCVACVASICKKSLVMYEEGRMCMVCIVCTMKNSKITSFFSHFTYPGGNFAWVTRGDRKTGFFGAKLQKNVYSTFNFLSGL
jgi:hypothetical protein